MCLCVCLLLGWNGVIGGHDLLKAMTVKWYDRQDGLEVETLEESDCNNPGMR